MLTARSRGTNEGFLQILFIDLESLQTRLKRALFFWTDAELVHVCIYRLHRHDIAPQGTALSERLKKQIDVFQGKDAVDDRLDTSLRH
jgi:hypothetical protein